MRKFSSLLISKNRLTQLQDQLMVQENLLKRVRESLSAPLDQHCIGVIPRGEVLTLLVESSAWASRLRYLARDLLKQLHRRQIHFKRIQIRVSVDTKPLPRRKTSRRAVPLSRENAALLRCLARSMDEERLRAALQRLSRHTSE